VERGLHWETRKAGQNLVRKGEGGLTVGVVKKKAESYSKHRLPGIKWETRPHRIKECGPPKQTKSGNEKLFNLRNARGGGCFQTKERH